VAGTLRPLSLRLVIKEAVQLVHLDQSIDLATDNLQILANPHENMEVNRPSRLREKHSLAQSTVSSLTADLSLFFM
jgi:hypothetical protein